MKNIALKFLISINHCEIYHCFLNENMKIYIAYCFIPQPQMIEIKIKTKELTPRR